MSLIAGPDVVSRGFIFIKEAEEIMDQVKAISISVADKCRESGITDWSGIKSSIRDAVSQYLYKKTKRSPMILIILTEV